MAPAKRPETYEIPESPYHSPRRARRDEETAYFPPSQANSRAYSPGPLTPSQTHDLVPFASPTREYDSRMDRNNSLSRKKSLIRPERRRMNKDHPNFYYGQHAASASNMDVLPSTTGNDPLLDDIGELDEDGRLRSEDELNVPIPRKSSHRNKALPYKEEKQVMREHSKLQRERTRKGTHKLTKEEKEQQRLADVVKPPSVWNVYCAIVTFWCPDFILQTCCGKPARAQRRAWREKMGLISIILLIMAFVGYLTFGFTATVCPAQTLRLQVNHVDNGYMIFHGQAYDISRSSHPAAYGIPQGSNVAYPPVNGGGRDGSFLFQNVNGKCKGLITKANGSDIPSDTDGNLAWYFPCNMFNQDGSSSPNVTDGPYLGYQCHLTDLSRQTFYGQDLRTSGDVFFTWSDIKNSSRNLMVWSGSVLDLNLLNWFNTSQVNVPTMFNQLADTNNVVNRAVRGRDITHTFAANDDTQIAQCLEQIIKVGSVDTDTVGCIASKVVLYISLAFILSIVLAKFLLALLFQWFLSRKYAAAKTSQSTNHNKRNQQIEEWTNDIYTAPQRLAGDVGSTVAASSDKSKRTSAFLPTTSRYTNPYAGVRLPIHRPSPTTMVSQQSTAGLLAPNFHHNNTSRDRLSYADSDAYGDDVATYGPSGFIHESVVPQPPADWQPNGFPLIHTLCLVTAYSEGVEGIRSTLDSIATTDYPNSHKTILVICDGLIKGHGETQTTPDIVVGMMQDFSVLPEEVPAFSYVAVASGAKRHNMAKIYAGFYDYGADSVIPYDKQQRVPMICVVKTGTPDEAKKSKPGNRGKRDSQIILMSFLQKVIFNERMTELEYELFNGLWKITGVSPDYYETVLMVDADTKVFPDAITHMISAMVKDPEIMGLCGETKIANKRQSWVTAIQVFEYFISHHLSKSFESVFGGVTCLPGCFSMYRIKAPKGGQHYWVPILANPDVVEHYSENVVETLHQKNLLLLGEDRYLSTLMLRTFPKRKQVFVPQAVCKTTVPDTFSVLLSQRRRWINSTIHNLMELVLVRDLCGTFCFSMQFVVFVDLVGTLVLPAAIAFTIYVIVRSIIGPAEVITLVLLALILGLPAILIVLTAHRWSYVAWMFIYLLSLPIWNGILPLYAFWKFDDFSWGETRRTEGEASGKKVKKAGIEYEGEFDSSKILMRTWAEFERERRAGGGEGW